MSAAAANSYYFRRRTIGRAASPPTWACYEQIPYDGDDYSDSGPDSCSEDDDEYSGAHGRRGSGSDSEDKDRDITSGDMPLDRDDPSHDLDMDMEEEGDGEVNEKAVDSQKDIKGKQRAVEHEPEKSRRQHRRKRPPVYTLRPILTIQKSQGFVWNQDLFVPPYIKDRYIASTSPPNSMGFISTSASSTNSGLTDYEVEVVEIRVKEGELDCIMP
ncbi:hypothetical protein LshimejAT787_1801260 [Lyophyllum shimeji]|uniref:Uncharacterized protein n=1 Tax=Lyophyllum shimeji TaxID=47721 RepID=A0A9P3Q0D6_LYOSH|nr:hypothetical protein LshimejAT787_1801260 [Lyophyllum shimeji]